MRGLLFKREGGEGFVFGCGVKRSEELGGVEMELGLCCVYIHAHVLRRWRCGEWVGEWGPGEEI